MDPLSPHKKNKRCQSWTPLANLSGSAHDLYSCTFSHFRKHKTTNIFSECEPSDAEVAAKALVADNVKCSDTNNITDSRCYSKQFLKREKSVFDLFSGPDTESDLDSVFEYVSNIGDDEKCYVTTPYSLIPWCGTAGSNCGDTAYTDITYTECQDDSVSIQSDNSAFAAEFRDRSKLEEFNDTSDTDDRIKLEESECDFDNHADVDVDDVDSGIVIHSFSRTNSALSKPVNEPTDWLDNLDLNGFENTIPLNEKTDQHTEESNEQSLEVADTCLIDEVDDSEQVDWDSEQKTESDKASPTKDINDFTMSREARFAIMETLHDMKSKGKRENGSADIRNKGVATQKRLQSNRLKYNKYKTMAETKNLFIDRNESRVTMSNNVRGSMSRYKSLDSEGETAKDDYSSAFSSELNMKDDEASSSAEDVQIPTKTKVKLLPNINTKRKSAKRQSSAASRFYALEKAKMTNYRIPGVGKFNIMASPESDFRITPPGFDSRYEPQPYIFKEEREQPPEDVKEKSIQKCKKWLKHVHLSPLSSLQPVRK